jgi:N-acetylmuramoyl-L-alanine amidase
MNLNTLEKEHFYIMADKISRWIKRGIFLLLIPLVIAVPLFAQKKPDVLLKFSTQDRIMRIVLESEESFLTNAKTTTSVSQIKIEFPGPFHLRSPEELPFEIVPTDKLLTINLKEKGEIKLFKLSSPARIVLDIQRGEKQPVQIPFKIFVIDAGHGGYDYGITLNDMKEKDINLSLAQDLNVALSKKGKKVFLTRKGDQYMSLLERIKFANQKTPDAFLSFHSSMSDNFVLYLPKFKTGGLNEMVDQYSLSSNQKKFMGKSKALSESIGKALKDEFKKNIIYRELPLPILISIGTPSVVIEYPSPTFITYDQPMKMRLLNAITSGLAMYGQ